jgi:hypothetical protein
MPGGIGVVVGPVLPMMVSAGNDRRLNRPSIHLGLNRPRMNLGLNSRDIPSPSAGCLAIGKCRAEPAETLHRKHRVSM